MRNSFFLSLLTVLIPLFLSPGAGAQEEPVGQAPTLEQMALAVYGGPAGVVEQGMTHLTVAAEGVFYASRVNGGMRLVTTGTLTQAAAGTLMFQYAPTPNDRLRVVMADGKQADYFVSQMQGNFTVDAATFLASDHLFEVRVVAGGELDLAFSSGQRRRSAYSAESGRNITVKGSFVHDQQTLTVDLTAAGSVYTQVDSSGSEHRTSLRYQGTLTAPGVAVKVDESWDFHIVTAVRRLGRSGGSASTTQRTINSTFEVGEDSYGFTGARVQTQFKNGKPSFSNQYWTLKGTLVKNGEAIGQLGWVPTYYQSKADVNPVAARIDAVLTVGDEKIVLQKWMVRG